MPKHSPKPPILALKVWSNAVQAQFIQVVAHVSLHKFCIQLITIWMPAKFPICECPIFGKIGLEISLDQKILCSVPDFPSKWAFFKTLCSNSLGVFLFLPFLRTEKKKKKGKICWKMTNVKIICIYEFFFPTFCRGLLQIKVQVLPQHLRFFIFHSYCTEDDGINTKWCQCLFGQYLDQ